jgi:hypothetical protein
VGGGLENFEVRTLKFEILRLPERFVCRERDNLSAEIARIGVYGIVSTAEPEGVGPPIYGSANAT